MALAVAFGGPPGTAGGQCDEPGFRHHHLEVCSAGLPCASAFMLLQLPGRVLLSCFPALRDPYQLLKGPLFGHAHVGVQQAAAGRMQLPAAVSCCLAVLVHGRGRPAELQWRLCLCPGACWIRELAATRTLPMTGQACAALQNVAPDGPVTWALMYNSLMMLRWMVRPHCCCWALTAPGYAAAPIASPAG